MTEPSILGERLGGRTRRSTAAQESYEWLKRRISTIPRDVGVMITETEVAEEAGIGRTPAREILQRLEGEGHLQIIPRKGIYIAPISDAEVKHVIDSRRAVERWSAEEVIARGSLSVDVLESLIDEQRGTLDNPSHFMESDRGFHEMIIKAAGNPILTSFYEQLSYRQMRMGISVVSQISGRSSEVLDEHRAIAEAIRDRDVEGARQAVERHLDSTLSALSRIN